MELYSGIKQKPARFVAGPLLSLSGFTGNRPNPQANRTNVVLLPNEEETDNEHLPRNGPETKAVFSANERQSVPISGCRRDYRWIAGELKRRLINLGASFHKAR